MIRSRTVSAGAASSKYYEKDGYYTPGSDEARKASEWFGRAAKEAGLVGEVDGEKFTSLLEGQAPDGQIMGVMKNGERKHRHGLDITMNAPKEVSVIALVMGDERVVEAHDKAVRDVAAYVEDKLMVTRVGVNGETQVVPAPNLIAGVFRHDTSRKLDPHLHSHFVIANMVKTDPGDKYRAIHNDLISENALLLTQIYQSRLAHEMRGLGYDASLNREGFLEVKGLETLPGQFSKRSLEMARSLAERGLEPTGQNKQIAALMTRDAKQIVERADLQPFWDKQAELEGWSKDRQNAFVRDAVARSKALEAARETGDDTRRDTQTSPSQGKGDPSEVSQDPALISRSDTKTTDIRDAVDFAIRDISERQAVYHESELKAVALRRLAVPDIRAIDTEIARLQVEDKRLYPFQTDKGTYYSDSETLMAEREVFRAYRSSVREPGVQIEKSIAFKLSWDRTSETALTRRLEASTLTTGQKDAIKLSLLGEGRFAGVQGYAGTGKTFMLSKLRDYAERYGYSVEGIAPSHTARGELDKVIPGAKTITAFIQDHKNGDAPAAKPNRILVVDEAAMVSTKDFRDLMNIANEAGIARVIFQGDIKQLESVGAGIPYKQLQKIGMPTALMDDVRRQENELSREAVLHAMRGEVREAFAKIGGLEAHNDVSARTAQSWLDLSKSERQTTGVLVLTNARRREVNDIIRAGLMQEGTLSGTSRTLPTIDPVNLTRAAAGDAGSYRIGDTVLSVGALKSYGIRPYDLMNVTGIDTEKNRITLLLEGARKGIEIQLGQNTQAAQKLVAFKEAPREFTKGDLVKFNLADRDADVMQGQQGVIEKLTKKTALIRLETGEERKIDLASFAGRGLDHAYALTAHAYQGRTINDIIVGMGSRERLATQKALYVQISRVKNEATIITDDVPQLIQTIQRETGESRDALEEVVRAQIAKKFQNATRGTTLPDFRAPVEFDPQAEPLKLTSNEREAGGQSIENTQRNDVEMQAQKGSQEGPQKEVEKQPEDKPLDPQKDTLKSDADQLPEESKTGPTKEVSKEGAEKGEVWDKDAAWKAIEEGWEKLIEDRSRGRGERSR